MSEDSVPLVVANVLLAVLVLVPALLVAGAGVSHALRHRRDVTYVDVPGVGRIPVLRR